MRRETRDCVVLGGGPAGATFAGILRKYAPNVSVTVLERDRFPRWRIGESTIPVANAVFRDLEVLDQLERSTFVKKMGITFVWGRDRNPWDADFLEVKKEASTARTGPWPRATSHSTASAASVVLPTPPLPVMASVRSVRP